MMYVEFDIEVCQETEPVRGNAMCSGNPETDKFVEDEILAEIDDGNVWAWANVKVTAHIGDIECSDYLGCCSYANREDFLQCGYYLDMKSEVLAKLYKKYVDRMSAIGYAKYELAIEHEVYEKRQLQLKGSDCDE